MFKRIISKLYFLVKDLLSNLFPQLLLTRLTFFLSRINFYREIKISEKIIYFYIPNNLIDWRVKTLFSKEPDTLDWINGFKSNEIFWDIGANIGIYSLYAASKINMQVISFESSMNNLRVLSKNISINNFQNNIKLFQLPLLDKKNIFMTMNETNDIEGAAHNSFGKSLDDEGNEFKPLTSYKIFGTSIDNILDEKILELPNHIKIDVDGFEHKILAGADKYLSFSSIKSILVEVNENYFEQYTEIIRIMKKKNFIIKKKSFLDLKKFNYIFCRDDLNGDYN
jgi:FkbM family methyltransferase